MWLAGFYQDQFQLTLLNVACWFYQDQFQLKTTEVQTVDSTKFNNLLAECSCFEQGHFLRTEVLTADCCWVNGER